MTAFLSLDRQLPRFDDILDKPDTIAVPSEVSAQLMILFQAVDKLQDQDSLSKFMRFVKRLPSSEIQAVFFTMMVRSKNGRSLARSNMDIAKWATENHELF